MRETGGCEGTGAEEIASGTEGGCREGLVEVGCWKVEAIAEGGKSGASLRMLWKDGDAAADGRCGCGVSTAGFTSGGEADFPFGTVEAGVGGGFSPLRRASFSLRSLMDRTYELAREAPWENYLLIDQLPALSQFNFLLVHFLF